MQKYFYFIVNKIFIWLFWATKCK